MALEAVDAAAKASTTAKRFSAALRNLRLDQTGGAYFNEQKMATIFPCEFPAPQPTTTSLARLHREVGEQFYLEIWEAVIAAVEGYWMEAVPASTPPSYAAGRNPRIDAVTSSPEPEAPRHRTVPQTDPLRDRREPETLRGSSWTKQARVEESVLEMRQDLNAMLPPGVYARHTRAIKDLVCRAHRAVLAAIEAEDDQDELETEAFVNLTAEDFQD
ncbi:hypothetical protein PpBr36_00088 [Pyricularia pennisetigena]|uniref:hypothetical protein n=1 Tax=Pyricularia pennisetigena TaxID=1578925 RepID=UPI001152775B|nr:hypothetical protein PpBr36_00088 [Pyricularia pennisetigena]TLS29229.1 hypothetical protein PpBr36_00088 [Pyricularia pennisetigena]